MRMILLLLPATFLVSCATDPNRDLQYGSEPEEQLGQAHPAVYEVDSFRMQKWQHRRPASNSRFFFKKCGAVDGKTYWSKTSYECSRF